MRRLLLLIVFLQHLFFGLLGRYFPSLANDESLDPYRFIPLILAVQDLCVMIAFDRWDFTQARMLSEKFLEPIFEIYIWFTVKIYFQIFLIQMKIFRNQLNILRIHIDLMFTHVYYQIYKWYLLRKVRAAKREVEKKRKLLLKLRAEAEQEGDFLETMAVGNERQKRRVSRKRKVKTRRMLERENERVTGAFGQCLRDNDRLKEGIEGALISTEKEIERYEELIQGWAQPDTQRTQRLGEGTQMT